MSLKNAVFSSLRCFPYLSVYVLNKLGNYNTVVNPNIVDHANCCKMVSFIDSLFTSAVGVVTYHY